MKQETRPVWVTDDGEVFDKESDAEEHEIKIRERARKFSQLKVYSVNHGFDATEGKGYFAHTLIISNASLAVVTQWCLDKFGTILQPWYGDGFYEAWHLSATEFTAERAMSLKGVNSFNKRATEICVVSPDDFTGDGLPASEYPWPRKKRNAK